MFVLETMATEGTGHASTTRYWLRFLGLYRLLETIAIKHSVSEKYQEMLDFGVKEL